MSDFQSTPPSEGPPSEWMREILREIRNFREELRATNDLIRDVLEELRSRERPATQFDQFVRTADTRRPNQRWRTFAAFNDLRDDTPAPETAADSAPTGGAAPPLKDVMENLQKDAASLFATPHRAAPDAPGAVIDSLDFELRGDLAHDQKTGSTTFAPGQVPPAGPAVMRFTMRPQVRIELAESEKK